jgi:hypothetical protein
LIIPKEFVMMEVNEKMRESLSKQKKRTVDIANKKTEVLRKLDDLQKKQDN